MIGWSFCIHDRFEHNYIYIYCTHFPPERWAYGEFQRSYIGVSHTTLSDLLFPFYAFRTKAITFVILVLFSSNYCLFIYEPYGLASPYAWRLLICITTFDAIVRRIKFEWTMDNEWIWQAKYSLRIYGICFLIVWIYIIDMHSPSYMSCVNMWCKAALRWHRRK